MKSQSSNYSWRQRVYCRRKYEVNKILMDTIMKIINILFEYECHPIWMIYEHGGSDPIDPISMPISKALKNDFLFANNISINI